MPPPRPLDERAAQDLVVLCREGEADGHIAVVPGGVLAQQSGFFASLLQPQWREDTGPSRSVTVDVAVHDVRPLGAFLRYVAEYAGVDIAINTEGEGGGGGGAGETEEEEGEEEEASFYSRCRYADHISAFRWIADLSASITPRNVFCVATLPSFTASCERYLLDHFEDVFCFGCDESNMDGLAILLQGEERMTQHGCRAGLLNLVQNVFASDELDADEGTILKVALGLHRRCGPEVGRSLLFSVRLNDVGLSQLDDLRQGDDSVATLLLKGLCEAYAYHSHIATRSRFLPFTSRVKKLFTFHSDPTLTLRETFLHENDVIPIKFATYRYNLVAFNVELFMDEQSGAVGVSLTGEHTFAEQVLVEFCVTVGRGGGGDGVSKTVRQHAFSEFNIPLSINDVGLTPADLKSKTWSVSGSIKFLEERTQECSSDGHSASQDEIASP